MTEGRTSAAEANVDAEDRPIDAPASTGTTGAGDVTGSAGANGHESAGDSTTSGADAATSESSDSGTSGTESSGTKDSSTAESGTAESGTKDSSTEDSGAASETVPAATLPGDDSGSAPAHGDAADNAGDTKAGDTKAGDTKAGDTKAGDTKAGDTKAGDTKAGDTKADGSKTAETTAAAKTGATAGDADATATGDEEWAEAEDQAYKKELRKGFAFGAAGGILVGAIVALLLGALVWPGYLLGPGKPDDTASQVTQALSAKDGPALDNLSCKGPDGKPVSQLSGQVLQFIAKVSPAGPATTVIDTEARAPVDVTLSVQGQTQTLPSELVLGESKGDWCLKGLAQRQQ